MGIALDNLNETLLQMSQILFFPFTKFPSILVLFLWMRSHMSGVAVIWKLALVYGINKAYSSAGVNYSRNRGNSKMIQSWCRLIDSDYSGWQLNDQFSSGNTQKWWFVWWLSWSRIVLHGKEFKKEGYCSSGQSFLHILALAMTNYRTLWLFSLFSFHMNCFFHRKGPRNERKDIVTMLTNYITLLNKTFKFKNAILDFAFS